MYSGVTCRGHSAPLTFFTGKFLLTNQEKKGKEKRENGQEKRKIVEGNEENVNCKGKKVWKRAEDLFLMSLLETTEIGFWCTNMEISTKEKSRKVTSPPPPYSSYASAHVYTWNVNIENQNTGN